MASKNKMTQVLDNGTEIKTTADGWNEKEVAEFPVLMAGWKEGKSSHHPISLGLAKAAIAKCPDIHLGNFEAENEAGEAVLVPVVDPLKLNQLMQESFCEANGITDIPTYRIAGSRSASKKELEAANSALSAIANDSAVMEVLKTSDPDRYESLQAYRTEESGEEEVEADSEAEEAEESE